MASTIAPPVYSSNRVKSDDGDSVSSNDSIVSIPNAILPNLPTNDNRALPDHSEPVSGITMASLMSDATISASNMASATLPNNYNNDDEDFKDEEEEQGCAAEEPKQQTLVGQLFTWANNDENFFFTKEQIRRFQKQFSFFDKDNSGSVSVEELGLVFNQMDVDWSQSEVEEMIREIDVDQSGYIEFNEFLGLMARKLYEQPHTLQELKEFYDFLDKDKDEIIAYEELHNLAAFLEDTDATPEQLRCMISEADSNGTGKISFLEFAEIMDALVYEEDDDYVDGENDENDENNENFDGETSEMTEEQRE